MKLSSTETNLFWKKKVIISYVLSILVFMIHISSFHQHVQNHNTISIINEKVSFFFSTSITSVAVPMFFILSGIAFFRNYENRTYLKRIKSKFVTLMIPFFAWNTIWMIFNIICSYSFLSSFFIGREKVDLTFINILQGVFFYKYNGPFWFIFDLFVFILFSPVIDLVVKNKYIGITTITTLLVLLVFRIGLPQNIFYTQDSIIYFLTGALIGKHWFSHMAQKSSRLLRIGSVIYIIVIVSLKNIFPHSSYTIKPLVQTVIRIIFAYALWNTFDLFIDKIKERPLFFRSFFVYAMHSNVSAIITKLIVLIFSTSEWFAIPNFFLTMILSLAVINLFAIVVSHISPLLYFILSGKKPTICETIVKKTA